MQDKKRLACSVGTEEGELGRSEREGEIAEGLGWRTEEENRAGNQYGPREG